MYQASFACCVVDLLITEVLKPVLNILGTPHGDYDRILARVVSDIAHDIGELVIDVGDGDQLGRGIAYFAAPACDLVLGTMRDG